MGWPVRSCILCLLVAAPGCLSATTWPRSRAAAPSAGAALAQAGDTARPRNLIIRPTNPPKDLGAAPPPEAIQPHTPGVQVIPARTPQAPRPAEEPDPSPADDGPQARKAHLLDAKPEELNRLVRILKAFLDDQPEAALQLLKEYPQKDQDVLLALVPILAGVERPQAWPGRLDPSQKLAVLDVLHSLQATLAPSAPLVVKKMEFARNVRGFGRYDPLPSPVFRPGDAVFLYAEIDNLRDQRLGENHHVIRLSSQLTIRREGTSEGWGLKVPTTPDASRSPRNDHHVAILFRIPNEEVPPGAYSLLVELFDMDSGRSVERMLHFRVTNQSTSEPASARR